MKLSKMVRLLSVICLVFTISGCATNTQTGKNEHSNDPGQAMSRTWQWVSTVTPVERITVAAPERYTMLLQPDGRSQVRFDCNRGGGKYKIAEGQLSFGPLVSTRMACPPDTQDGTFMRDLQRVTSFFIEDGVLFLELPYDSGTMQFRREP